MDEENDFVDHASKEKSTHQDISETKSAPKVASLVE